MKQISLLSKLLVYDAIKLNVIHYSEINQMEMDPMRAKYLKPAILATLYIGFSHWSGTALAQHADASNLYKRSLAATCANCHGTDGKGVVDGGMPLINNLTSQEMLAKLKAYKSGALESFRLKCVYRPHRK